MIAGTPTYWVWWCYYPTCYSLSHLLILEVTSLSRLYLVWSCLSLVFLFMGVCWLDFLVSAASICLLKWFDFRLVSKAPLVSCQLVLWNCTPSSAASSCQSASTYPIPLALLLSARSGSLTWRQALSFSGSPSSFYWRATISYRLSKLLRIRSSEQWKAVSCSIEYSTRTPPGRHWRRCIDCSLCFPNSRSSLARTQPYSEI